MRRVSAEKREVRFGYCGSGGGGGGGGWVGGKRRADLRVVIWRERRVSVEDRVCVGKEGERTPRETLRASPARCEDREVVSKAASRGSQLEPGKRRLARGHRPSRRGGSRQRLTIGDRKARASAEQEAVHAETQAGAACARMPYVLSAERGEPAERPPRGQRLLARRRLRRRPAGAVRLSSVTRERLAVVARSLERRAALERENERVERGAPGEERAAWALEAATSGGARVLSRCSC